MDFSSRRRRGRHAAMLATARATMLATALLWAAARPSRAAPFDDPHVGGLTFSGPTSGTLAAVYWNPAALGLVRGNQLMLAGDARLTRVTVDRASINRADGTPGGDFQPGSATASDMVQPVQWPLGPGGFAGISTDLGSDRATLAFAVYDPYVEIGHYPRLSAGDEPTRYHRLDADFRNLALVPALAVRLSGSLRIGFAPGLLFSTGRLAFADPTTAAGPTAENPAGDTRYDISSGQGIGDAKFSLTLGGGIYYRIRNVSIGLAYTSHPFGGDVSGVQIAGERTNVTGPGGVAPNCRPASNDGSPPDSQSSRCVFGEIRYRLPDMFMGGVTWHTRAGWELTAMARWLRTHVMDRVDVRLTGASLQAAGLPAHLIFHQGFEDVWDVRLRAATWVKERVHVGAALRIETSAVPASDVNPGAVDGLKFEPMLLAEVNLGGHISLGAGYAVTVMSQVAAQPSSFQPQAAAQCATVTDGKPAGDLSNPGCVARAQGLAHPTAAGTYTRLVQDFGLSMTARF